MTEWLRDLDNRVLVKTIVFAGLLLGLWWNSHSGLKAHQQDVCVAVNDERAALKKYIETQLNRAEKSLPTIEYYRKHPIELGRQLALIQRQREETEKTFAPVSC